MAEGGQPKTRTIADRRGALVGRYVLLDPIAEGGMGVVYGAFDSQLDRKVAIKLLRPTVVKGEDAAEAEARLLREAQAMARLSHPNVVAIHDVGIVEGDVFLAMEYVEGGTLRDFLARKAPWREGLALLREAGRGLAAAHAAGLIHRDFKPDNILVGADGRVRVTDFGIARAAEDDRSRDVTLDTDRASGKGRDIGAATTPMQQKLASMRSVAAQSTPSVAGEPPLSSSRSLADPLTLTGDLLGTVGYMAPEQAFGERVDARSDQFSFCATLYLTLYGEKPYRDHDVDDYLMALTGPIRDAPPGSKIPMWIRRILVKGLSLTPSGRYGSMDELLAALDHDPAIKRRRWLTVGAVSLSALLTVLAFRRGAESRAPRCGPVDGDLSGVWDPAVKGDLKRAFDATGVASGAESFDRMAKALDAYATSWRAARTDACEATKVRFEQSEEVYALRTACLDREKGELRALTSLFRTVDKSQVEQSVKAAYGLTAVAWCADVNALRASPGLPVDPMKRAAVLTARSALATSASLSLTGKYAESFTEAERARSEAHEAGHGGTEAEALFAMGLVKHRMGQFDEASTYLGDAMATAYAAGNDPTLVRAASRLAFITGDKLYRPKDAQRLLSLARAGVERVGGSEELAADVLSTDAVLQNAQGYSYRAVPMLESLVRIYRGLLGESPTTAFQLNNLGYAQHLAGENASALQTLEESRAMFTSLYGTENLSVGITLCNLGAAHLGLGETEEAERLLHRSLAIFDRESPEGYWAAWALQYLALGSNLDGDPSAAIVQGRRGLAISEKLASQRLLPGVALGVADGLLATGAPKEALALCDRAIEIQERVGLIDPERLYDWDALRCRGEALLALGRAPEAVVPLERSVALPRRVFPWDLARAKFALARAVVSSDGARAVVLAQEAHDAAVGPAQAKGLIAQIEAWQRVHP